MKYSSAVDSFHLLPSASTQYTEYSNSLISLAIEHHVDLFLPVCGVASEVEDAKAAETMAVKTGGRCKTFIQDPETISQLHDKDEFINLVDSLGFPVPRGKLVYSVDEAMDFLYSEAKDEHGRGVGFIIKCTELDENRGDLTTYPFAGDDIKMSKTRKHFDGLKLKMSRKYPYVLQEYIPGQGKSTSRLGYRHSLEEIADPGRFDFSEWCTHASVVDGQITAFVTAPSNDMLMTYEDWTNREIGKRAEQWTRDFLNRLGKNPVSSGKKRRLTGHFSFDFILSERNGEMYPIECNPRVHTAIILLPLSKLASVYPAPHETFHVEKVLKPLPGTAPRSWIYNDLIMRYLPYALPFTEILDMIHPSLPACHLTWDQKKRVLPQEGVLQVRVDPTLIADDPIPFLVLWHVFWPYLLVTRWWQGKKWTRVRIPA